VDALADLLARARARGGAFGRTVLATPWGVTFDTPLPLAVHAVLGGEAWVATGDSTARLLTGDIALIRGAGTSHLGACEAPRLLRLNDAVQQFGTDRREIIFPGEPTAELVCGAYAFSGDLCTGMLETLPPILHLRAGAQTAALRPLLALLADEVARQQPGQQVVLDRALDLVLVYVLRAYYAQPDANAPRWYLALDDGPVGAALRAIHEQPAHDWDVATLAAIGGLSRAAFARRFADLVGEPPLTYLTGWRMKLACEHLRDPTMTLARVATETGYSNQYAFATAFKRHVGDPPGRWAARARTASNPDRAPRESRPGTSRPRHTPTRKQVQR
jgi:AraC-like DNA-binding protein